MPPAPSYVYETPYVLRARAFLKALRVDPERIDRFTAHFRPDGIYRVLFFSDGKGGHRYYRVRYTSGDVCRAALLADGMRAAA